MCRLLVPTDESSLKEKSKQADILLRMTTHLDRCNRTAFDDNIPLSLDDSKTSALVLILLLLLGSQRHEGGVS